MAVPFILLGGAALAGITGAVKSVSAHTKNANAKQIVAEAQNIYDEAREMLEEQRTCTAECLKRLGALKVDIWSKEMNDFIRTFRAFKNVRMESDVAGDERLKLKCQGTENLKNMEVAALKATEMAVMTDFMKKTASIAENYSDFLVRFRSAFYPVVNEMKYMEQRTRQKQKRMLYDSDDEKIDFNSLTEAEQKKIHQAWLMAQIMCSVLSEPLLTPAGELASEAQTTLQNARNVYPAFAQGRYGF